MRTVFVHQRAKVPNVHAVQSLSVVRVSQSQHGERRQHPLGVERERVLQHLGGVQEDVSALTGHRSKEIHTSNFSSTSGMLLPRQLAHLRIEVHERLVGGKFLNACSSRSRVARADVKTNTFSSPLACQTASAQA